MCAKLHQIRGQSFVGHIYQQIQFVGSLLCVHCKTICKIFNVRSMSFFKIRYNVQNMKLHCFKDFRKYELISGQMDKYVDEQSYVMKEERQLILWPN